MSDPFHMSGPAPDHPSPAPLARTPDQVLGPFYPFMHEPSCGGDLTALPGRRHQAQGQIIHVMGRVSDRYGTPVRDAKLIIWQANAFGRHSHHNDLSEAPLDPNFEGFGVICTDDDGRYHLKTIKPGGYLAGPSILRPPHIHFEVFGRRERLITQMYFAEEPHNATDRFLQSATRPDALITMLEPPTPNMEPGAMRAVFNIVLSNG
jgi:protocatechuate 3,4-dioxygenase beta subunit